jgi:hypothetical protein
VAGRLVIRGAEQHVQLRQPSDHYPAIHQTDQQKRLSGHLRHHAQACDLAAGWCGGEMRAVRCFEHVDLRVT